MNEIEITHTCGHTDMHNAWGKRIAWLASKPCRECAGIGPRVIKDPKTIAQLVYEACEKSAIPAPKSEYRFLETRRWKFDFAWPEFGIALEVEGSPGMGRHTRPAGFLADCDKYNTAAMLGWFVFRCVRKTAESTLCYVGLAIARFEFYPRVLPGQGPACGWEGHNPPSPHCKPSVGSGVSNRKRRGRTLAPIRAAGAIGSIP